MWGEPQAGVTLMLAYLDPGLIPTAFLPKRLGSKSPGSNSDLGLPPRAGSSPFSAFRRAVCAANDQRLLEGEEPGSGPLQSEGGLYLSWASLA